MLEIIQIRGTDTECGYGLRVGSRFALAEVSAVRVHVLLSYELVCVVIIRL